MSKKKHGKRYTEEQIMRILKELEKGKPLAEICCAPYSLIEQDQTLPDQKSKHTQNLTIHRVSQMFEGIHLLIQTEQFRKLLVTNFQPVHL